MLVNSAEGVRTQPLPFVIGLRAVAIYVSKLETNFYLYNIRTNHNLFSSFNSILNLLRIYGSNKNKFDN